MVFLSPTKVEKSTSGHARRMPQVIRQARLPFQEKLLPKSPAKSFRMDSTRVDVYRPVISQAVVMWLSRRG